MPTYNNLSKNQQILNRQCERFVVYLPHTFCNNLSAIILKADLIIFNKNTLGADE